MNSKILILLGVLLLGAAAGILIFSSPGTVKNNNAALTNLEEPISLTVYKTPTCGCCVGYVVELREQGFNVEVVSTQDMRSIKDEYNIPHELESCHTAVVGDYFVEGHVPIEAVNKMLSEKPAISGIALPGMPAGSPGMPGTKKGAFTIFKIVENKYSEFISI